MKIVFTEKLTAQCRTGTSGGQMSLRNDLFREGAPVCRKTGIKIVKGIQGGIQGIAYSDAYDASSNYLVNTLSIARSCACRDWVHSRSRAQKCSPKRWRGLVSRTERRTGIPGSCAMQLCSIQLPCICHLGNASKEQQLGGHQSCCLGVSCVVSTLFGAMQGVLDRVQEQLQEQRLMRALSQRRGQTIDIQIGFNVYLDVPQEMRSRLWLVVLKEPSLAIPFQVCTPASEPCRFQRVAMDIS